MERGLNPEHPQEHAQPDIAPRSKKGSGCLKAALIAALAVPPPVVAVPVVFGDARTPEDIIAFYGDWFRANEETLDRANFSSDSQNHALSPDAGKELQLSLKDFVDRAGFSPEEFEKFLTTTPEGKKIHDLIGETLDHYPNNQKTPVACVRTDRHGNFRVATEDGDRIQRQYPKDHEEEGSYMLAVRLPDAYKNVRLSFTGSKDSITIRPAPSKEDLQQQKAFPGGTLNVFHEEATNTFYIYLHRTLSLKSRAQRGFGIFITASDGTRLFTMDNMFSKFVPSEEKK